MLVGDRALTSASPGVGGGAGLGGTGIGRQPIVRGCVRVVIRGRGWDVTYVRPRFAAGSVRVPAGAAGAAPEREMVRMRMSWPGGGAAAETAESGRSVGWFRGSRWPVPWRVLRPGGLGWSAVAAGALAALAVPGAAQAAGPAGVSPALTWTRQAPATNPPYESGASMAYDAASGNVVLFGGNGRT